MLLISCEQRSRGEPTLSPRSSREYRAPKASNQNLLQARKGTKGALHYQEIDERANPSSRLGPGAMSSIALQLSRYWTTSLVVLLVTPSSVVVGEDPSPTAGKYSCSVDNIVGLQTSSQTGTKFAGRIDADAQQKFFVTIEENKQLPEDRCFSADALDDLKKLRRGEKPGTNSKANFLDPLMFFRACQAQFRLSTNGSPIDSLYHSDNLNIFRDEFSQFRLRSGLSYIWQFHDLKGNACVAEGRGGKIDCGPQALNVSTAEPEARAASVSR